MFHVGTLTGSWARTIVDLNDPDFGQRPISFDPAYAAKRQDVVLAHLNHPLVAMATRLLRAEVWGSDKSTLARVASIRVHDPAVQDEVLAAYSRLVLIGADGKRLHEELVPAGGTLRGGVLQPPRRRRPRQDPRRGPWPRRPPRRGLRQRPADASWPPGRR